MPPLEPPGVWFGSHGLRVAPFESVSVKQQIMSSGTFVFPSTTAPASRSRATITESVRLSDGLAPVPNVVAWPATSASSLIATGTPFSAPAPLAAAGVGGVGLGERLLGQDHAVRVQLPSSRSIRSR